MKTMMRWVVCGFVVLFACSAYAESVDRQWMAVFINGKKVGYFKKVRETRADTVVTTELMTFSVDAGTGTVEKLTVDETVELTDGSLVRFRHEAAQGQRLYRIEGKRDGSQMHLSLVSEKEKHEKDIMWPEGTLMAEGRRLLAKSRGLVLGTQYQYQQLFPETLTFGDVQVSVGPLTEVDVLGKKMKLTETHELISLNGRTLEYIVYRDASTRPVKIVAPSLFMELVDCDESYAMTPPEAMDKE